MQFKCGKDVILNAVLATAKAASSKSAVQALEGLLLELDNNILTITGYNLEIGIRTEIAV
ncbi:MAG: DNA polymerase III subunit beta, partial [Oscillospiraceae bacterium]|nr:DNA polymerase III subunit beta [Oscillospiraceae bacterium]